MNLKRNLTILFFTFFSISFISFFLVSLFLLLQNSDEDNEEEASYYKFLEKDYSRNEISLGIVTLPNEIEGFLSDNIGHRSTLISPFGTEEFECFGICYCEGNRRSSQNTVIAGKVRYLLAAISSVVALNIADEYFSETCSKMSSSSLECGSKSIKSEVSNCKKVVNKRNKKSEEGSVEMRVYFCYGNCLDNLKITNFGVNQYRPSAKDKGFDCTKLKQEGDVEVYSHELDMTGKKQSLSSRMSILARIKFIDLYLRDFCKENSVVEYEYPQSIYHTLKSGEKKKYSSNIKKRGHMCIGNTSGGKTESQLHNVKCRQMDPEPTDNAARWRDRIWWEKKEIWDSS